MTIDLRTCEVGQLLKDGRGCTLEYSRKSLDNASDYGHILWDREDQSEETFTDEGVYDVNRPKSRRDIVEILPLGKSKSPKHSEHPSVTAWERFPWITNRKPTLKDTTRRGENMGLVLTLDSFFFRFRHYLEVQPGEKWIHLPNWTPPKLTPQEEALALLKGKDDDWMPSAEEWLVFRQAIKP